MDNKDIDIATEALLQELKELGQKRKDMADYFNVQEASLNSMISKGGSESLYNKLKGYRDHIIAQKTDSYIVMQKVKQVEEKCDVLIDAVSELIALYNSQSKSVVKKRLLKGISE